MHDPKHAGFPWPHAAPAPARSMPHSFTTVPEPDKERVRLRCIVPGCAHTFLRRALSGTARQGPDMTEGTMTSRDFTNLRRVIKDAIDSFSGERTDKIGAFLDAFHRGGWVLVHTGVLPEDVEPPMRDAPAEERQPGLPEISR